jgi:hypothetical protein
MKRAAGEQLGGNLEQYGTPRWVTKLLVNSGALPTRGRFLEPFAGPDARIIQEVQGEGIHWSASELHVAVGSELWHMHQHDLIDELHVGDYFAFDWIVESKYDVACTNPPFSRAAEALVKMRREAAMVVMLLPLAWGCSAERHELLAKDPPHRKLIVPDRIAFLDPTKEYECPTCNGDGTLYKIERPSGLHDPHDTPCDRCDGKGAVRATSPSENHAWWCWLPGRARVTVEETLPLTPIGVRNWWWPACVACSGLGRDVQRVPCVECAGAGRVKPKATKRAKKVVEVPEAAE